MFRDVLDGRFTGVPRDSLGELSNRKLSGVGRRYCHSFDQLAVEESYGEATKYGHCPESNERIGFCACPSAYPYLECERQHRHAPVRTDCMQDDFFLSWPRCPRILVKQC